jgi:hypothetical protein
VRTASLLSCSFAPNPFCEVTAQDPQGCGDGCERGTIDMVMAGRIEITLTATTEPERVLGDI